MSFKNRMDMHTHTDNSPDGLNGATLMCEHAVRLGLRAIAITDHCECNLYRSEKYDISARQSFFDAVKEKDIYSGFLVVSAGVELGQPMQDTAARDLALKRNYDFVLASLHNVPGLPDFYYIDFNDPENDAETLITRYYNEIIDMCGWGGFDSLAHLSYPFRYLANFDTGVSLCDFKPQLEVILKALADNGKALEINTSGLRSEINDTMPPDWIVKWFKELGGEFITIGSDAHRYSDIGAGIEYGMEMALSAGFKYAALYLGREPVMITIEK